MSDNEYGDGPKALRDALDAEKQARADLQKELSQLQAQVRGYGLKEAFSGLKLNPATAQFYPADRPTDEVSVRAWVEETKGVFNFGLPAEGDNGAGGSTVDPGVQGELERQQSAADGGLSLDKAQDMAARIRAAKSPEELNQLLGNGF